jgi:hypothetical protein
MFVDIDVTGDTLSKKVRNAEIAQYNFILGQYPIYFPPPRLTLIYEDNRSGW